jgi:hypothetical protein
LITHHVHSLLLYPAFLFISQSHLVYKLFSSCFLFKYISFFFVVYNLGFLASGLWCLGARNGGLGYYADEKTQKLAIMLLGKQLVQIVVVCILLEGIGTKKLFHFHMRHKFTIIWGLKNSNQLCFLTPLCLAVNTGYYSAPFFLFISRKCEMPQPGDPNYF